MDAGDDDTKMKSSFSFLKLRFVKIIVSGAINVIF